jgi:hypothetical protein
MKNTIKAQDFPIWEFFSQWKEDVICGLKGSSFVTMSIEAQEVYFKGIDPPGQTIHPGTFLPYSRQPKIQSFFSIAVPLNDLP